MPLYRPSGTVGACGLRSAVIGDTTNDTNRDLVFLGKTLKKLASRIVFSRQKKNDSRQKYHESCFCLFVTSAALKGCRVCTSYNSPYYHRILRQGVTLSYSGLH